MVYKVATLLLPLVALIGSHVGCGEPPSCRGQWGVITLTLNGVPEQLTTNATVDLRLEGKTTGFAGAIFSCPGFSDMGDGLAASCSWAVAPPTITLTGYGTDIFTVDEVVITLRAADGTLIVDGAVMPLSPAKLVDPEGPNIFCERNGALPP